MFRRQLMMRGWSHKAALHVADGIVQHMSEVFLQSESPGKVADYFDVFIDVVRQEYPHIFGDNDNAVDETGIQGDREIQGWSQS